MSLWYSVHWPSSPGRYALREVVDLYVEEPSAALPALRFVVPALGWRALAPLAEPATLGSCRGDLVLVLRDGPPATSWQPTDRAWPPCCEQPQWQLPKTHAPIQAA